MVIGCYWANTMHDYEHKTDHFMKIVLAMHTGLPADICPIPQKVRVFTFPTTS